MDDRPETRIEEIEALVAGHASWFHRIELAPGVVTPGSQDSPQVLRELDALGLPRDGSGRRVLDVGCMDGFFAFEMERRGAEVVGLDYSRPEVTGFSIASRVLGSRVEHRVENVYRLGPEGFGRFDMVLFLGVLYHLRSPMLALDRVRGVLHPGGLLFVETQLPTERKVRNNRAALWQYFPRDSLHRDWTNKWAPNLGALEAILEDCGFEVLETAGRGDRGFARARAVAEGEVEYFRRLDSATGMLDRL